MATTAEISLVREQVNDTGTPSQFTDERIGAAIDGSGSVEGGSAALWRAKAARYADLVDVSEGASRRSLGSLHEHALKMAAAYGAQADSITGTDGLRSARTRPIVRP